MSFVRGWWLVLGSVALIAAATLLPFGAIPASQMPPRWCFDCGGMWLADAISNVLLFLPLGLALACRGRGIAVVACSGVLLSFAVEFCQSVGIPPSRSPAIADITANAFGAMLGWLLSRYWRSVCCADARRSAMLAVSWWLIAVAILALTAAAAQTERVGEPKAVSLSSIEYAPGYGWYGGTPISAQVSSAQSAGPWTILHAGTGPIVAHADHGSNEWQVILQSVGRDSANVRRAIFFLHVAGDTTADVLIAQHNHDVDLVVRRRASSWGLNFPVISVAGVFSGQSPTDTIRVHVNATNRLMHLEATRGLRSERAQLALTPAIGWSMIQTLVGVQHPLVPVIQFLWLVTLFFPLAWWSGRTRRAGFLALSAAGTSVAICVVAPVLGGAPFSLQDLVSVAGIWTAGAALGWALLLRYPNSTRG